jgi:hypothetical protein
MQKKSVRTALTYALPGLLSVGFAVFAAFSERADRAGILFGGAAALVFLLLIFRLLPVFFDFFTENEGKSPCADLGARSRRRLHPWLQIVLSAFIIQFITIAAIYAADMNLNGYSGTVIQTYARLFITGKGSPVCAPDALSGLGLLSALGEYVFPRAIAAGIGVYRDAALLGVPTAGLVFALNTISVCAAAVILYELMLLGFEKRTAVFSVRVLLFSPMFVLLLQPTSGLSVFLLFSLAAAYCARRGYYVRSGLFAAAASAFNVFGLLLALLPITEGIRACRLKKRNGEKFAGSCARCVAGALLPAAVSAGMIGGLLYCGMLNDCFLKGAIGLRQGFGFMFESAFGLLSLDAPEIWVSAVSCIVLILLLFAGGRRIRLSYSLFCFAWMAIALPNVDAKYILVLTAAFPFLPLFVSAIAKNRAVRVIVGVLGFACEIAFAALMFI